MIGKLKGTLVESLGTAGLIETTGGVFYEVYLSPLLLSQQLPHPIEVYTYLQVRDDALVLFGFENRREYSLFQMLLSVSGVGPKSAFTIVSSPFSPGIYDAVRSNDVDYFKNMPGIGKKTALKIIVELSSKLKEDVNLSSLIESDDDKMVIEALVALGFSTKEIRTIVNKIDKTLSLQDQIKAGIRELSSR